jgi:hypothetical protein
MVDARPNRQRPDHIDLFLPTPIDPDVPFENSPGCKGRVVGKLRLRESFCHGIGNDQSASRPDYCRRSLSQSDPILPTDGAPASPTYQDQPVFNESIGDSAFVEMSPVCPDVSRLRTGTGSFFARNFNTDSNVAKLCAVRQALISPWTKVVLERPFLPAVAGRWPR